MIDLYFENVSDEDEKEEETPMLTKEPLTEMYSVAV